MANPIQLKRSTTAGNVPSSLVAGELAVNIPDRLGFIADGTGTIRQINLTSDAEKIAATAPIGAALAGKFDKAGGTILGSAALATAGDTLLTIEDTSAANTTFRRKSIFSSKNVNGGNDWLLRQTRPSDGAIQDFILPSAAPGTLWTTGNLDGAGVTAKLVRFLPDRSTFAPTNVAGAGEYSLANAQTIAPAGLAVKGNGWDGGAYIVHEGVDCDTSNSGQSSTKVNGFSVIHALDQALASGSSSYIRGGRQAGNFVLVKAVQTSANNPDRHYVGLVGQALDKAGDGGTSATPMGRVFGFNAYGGVQTNSFWENLTSGEHNTEYDPTATVDYHSGLAIVGILGKRGRTLDTGLAIGAIGPSFAFTSGTANTRGFGNGITFTNKNGRSPVESDSVLMTFDHSATVLRGFDFASVTFGAEILRTPNMALSESVLNLSKANATVAIGTTTAASSPRINFASGGSGAGIYDASIIATGGTSGTAGTGALTVQAGLWSFGTAGIIASLSTNASGYQAGRLYRDSNGFVKVVF